MCVLRPAADLVIAQPAFGRVMRSVVPRADSVAVCNTGLLRSLLAPAVVDGFAEHLVAPLERAGFAVDTYLQVVGKWPEGNGSTIYHDALAQAYRRSTVTLLPVQLPHFRCTPHKAVADGQRFLLGTSDILVQFVAIHDCYLRVERKEARRGQPYSHLMRVRTDLAFLSDLPISIFHNPHRVYVVASGMGPVMAGITCMNDHVFVCPRALCRSYFNLLELFQSQHCHSLVTNATDRHPDWQSIFATRASANGSLLPNAWSGPPTEPFRVPGAPKDWFTGQWYVFARHTATGRVCRPKEAPASCCGLIDEFPWWYTVVEVVPSRNLTERPHPSVNIQCSRIRWSHRGRKDDPEMASSESKCSALAASQNAAEQRPEWGDSPFVTTYRGECVKKWSCSRADRFGVSHRLVDATGSGGSDTGRRLEGRPQHKGELRHAAALAPTSSTADATHGPNPTCPSNGDFRDPTAIDAMLRARASPRRDIVLMLYGRVGKSGLTTGYVPVDMGWEGARYVQALEDRLSTMGIRNSSLVVTAATQDAVSGEMDGMVCRKVLRPLGLCCGWSAFGHEALTGNRWGWSQTHPHYMKMQLWWMAGQVVARGYNVLTLDYDIFLAQNPLELFSTPTFSRLDVVFAADSSFPVRPLHEGEEAESDDFNVVVACDAKRRDGSCACGRAPAPSINTAFCYARPKPAVVALFAAVASIIVKRLRTPPTQKGKQQLPQHVRLWEQDVINEAVYKMARLPQDLDGAAPGSHSRCHALDLECPATAAWNRSASGTTATALKLTKAQRQRINEERAKRWWVSDAPRTEGAWLADAPRLPAPAEGCDWEHRVLVPRTELVSASGSTAQFGLLPRSVVGRLCGRRRFPLSAVYQYINATNVLPCEFHAAADGSRSFLGQMALHAQMTANVTREAIWSALGLWRRSSAATPIVEGGSRAWSAPGTSANGAGSSSCYAHLKLDSTTGKVALSSKKGADNRGVLLSSSSVDHMIACLEPMPEGMACPCCWRLPKRGRGMQHVSGTHGWWTRDFSGCREFNILW